MTDPDEYVPSNREKVREPRSSRNNWCGGCDANILQAGETCTVCGHKEPNNRAPRRDRRL